MRCILKLAVPAPPCYHGGLDGADTSLASEIQMILLSIIQRQRVTRCRHCPGLTFKRVISADLSVCEGRGERCCFN